ncbi:hypothetical protein CCR78_00095 [Rhodovulum imhoffii]|nr:hypothetical protein [Rhodovulum imhoffii]
MQNFLVSEAAQYASKKDGTWPATVQVSCIVALLYIGHRVKHSSWCAISVPLEPTLQRELKHKGAAGGDGSYSAELICYVELC